MTRPSDIPTSIYEWAAIFYDENIHTPAIEMVARAFMAGQGVAPASLPSVGLTPRQVEALDFIQSFHAQHRTPPSFEQIRIGLGLASKSGVHRLVHGLVERGALDALPSRWRTVSVRRAA